MALYICRKGIVKGSVEYGAELSPRGGGLVGSLVRLSGWLKVETTEDRIIT